VVQNSFVNNGSIYREQQSILQMSSLAARHPYGFLQEDRNDIASDILKNEALRVMKQEMHHVDFLGPVQ